MIWSEEQFRRNLNFLSTSGSRAYLTHPPLKLKLIYSYPYSTRGVGGAKSAQADFESLQVLQYASNTHQTWWLFLN